MVGSTSSGFSDLVLASKRIEKMIKMGKIHNSASTSCMVKKHFVAYGKKREGETNVTAVIRDRTPTYHVPYQQVSIVAPFKQSQQQDFTIIVQ